MNKAIHTEQLTKQFEKPRGWRRLARSRPTTAVRDVSLDVAPGELFGLLGPNGAGKTTLVKMLCTLIVPTSGRAMVGGHSLADTGAIRARVGLVVSDERSFYWRLTAWQNLKFFAIMYGLRRDAVARRVAEVLADVDMGAHAHDRFGSFSTGMKQRIAIARGLLHQPDILFLDEPSRSLDPTATQKLHTLIRGLIAQRGMTVFLITHDLSEAETLCDRVAVMNQGRIRAVGPPSLLRQALRPRRQYEVRTARSAAALEGELRRLAPDLEITLQAEATLLRFTAGEGDARLTAVVDRLRAADLPLHSVAGEPPSLDQVFAHYTGEETTVAVGQAP